MGRFVQEGQTILQGPEIEEAKIKEVSEQDKSTTNVEDIVTSSMIGDAITKYKEASTRILDDHGGRAIDCVRGDLNHRCRRQMTMTSTCYVSI